MITRITNDVTPSASSNCAVDGVVLDTEVDAADINMANASQKELRFALKFHHRTKGIISQ